MVFIFILNEKKRSIIGSPQVVSVLVPVLVLILVFFFISVTSALSSTKSLKGSNATVMLQLVLILFSNIFDHQERFFLYFYYFVQVDPPLSKIQNIVLNLFTSHLSLTYHPIVSSCNFFIRPQYHISCPIHHIIASSNVVAYSCYQFLFQILQLLGIVFDCKEKGIFGSFEVLKLFEFPSNILVGSSDLLKVILIEFKAWQLIICLGLNKYNYYEEENEFHEYFLNYIQFYCKCSKIIHHFKLIKEDLISMLSKSWMFQNTFNHSNFNATLVSEPGNFVKPLAHCSYGSQNFSIVCEGYQNDQIAHKVMGVLYPSLLYYIQEYIPQSGQNNNHKERIGNLLLSVSEQIKEEELQGSCSIAIVYKVKDKIHCIRNDGLGIYLIDSKKNILIPLCQSPSLPFNVKKNGDKVGYFRVQMKSIEPLNIFETQYTLHYDELQLYLTQTNYKVVMGSIQCFCFFHSKQVIEHLGESKGLAQEKRVGEFMDEVKKRWRTIYHRDFTVICMNL